MQASDLQNSGSRGTEEMLIEIRSEEDDFRED